MNKTLTFLNPPSPQPEPKLIAPKSGDIVHLVDKVTGRPWGVYLVLTDGQWADIEHGTISSPSNVWEPPNDNKVGYRLLRQPLVIIPHA